jgi:hypothetical protein
LTVRELYAGGKILVSAFLDPKQTPKGVLRALYRRRWQVETFVTIDCTRYVQTGAAVRFG